MKTIKSLYIVLIMTSILMGVTGCMFKSEKSKTEDMLKYLSDRYGEEFAAEEFIQGSTFMPELYGGDQLLVHPAKNDQIPFYVFKNTESEGYNDNYTIAYFDYHMTEKYKQDIKSIDDRDMAVKLAFRLADFPRSPEYLKNTFEYLDKDTTYEGHIDLYVAVNAGNEQEIKNDSQFLYELYTFMKGITERDFEISVGYIKNDNFKEAEELIRISHTINFNWNLLEHDVIDYINIYSTEDIKDPSYFDTIFE